MHEARPFGPDENTPTHFLRIVDLRCGAHTQAAYNRIPGDGGVPICSALRIRSSNYAAEVVGRILD